MVLITFDMALEALNAVVDEKGGDYVYEGGRMSRTYVAYDEPSCIVGNALHRLGVPIPTLVEVDRSAIGGEVVSSRKVLDVLESSGFILDNDAVMLLATAQVLQDAEIPWGDAVREAREEPVEWRVIH
ncbi:hypothetical protein JYB64_20945 [Algoriphagus aestuarii]|nr:hypothetical protein [Algoriphagus aestuarii]